MLKGKEFNISKVNQAYFDRFLDKFDKKSRATYKVSIGGFLSEIGTNDFAKITPARMLKFVETKSPVQQKNAIAHLRSMMMYSVKNNINGAAEKVRKETLIWLLNNRAGQEHRKDDGSGSNTQKCG